jgi:hypothetical protein
VHHDGDEFVTIADAFAEQVGGYDAIEVLTGDGAIGRRLADERLSSDWQDFHRKMAHLVVVSAHANLSALRRGKPRR